MSDLSDKELSKYSQKDINLTATRYLNADNYKNSPSNKTNNNKKIEIICGVSGSGKTTIIENSLLKDDYYIINPDEYRLYHPNAENIKIKELEKITDDNIIISIKIDNKFKIIPIEDFNKNIDTYKNLDIQFQYMDTSILVDYEKPTKYDDGDFIFFGTNPRYVTNELAGEHLSLLIIDLLKESNGSDSKDSKFNLDQKNLVDKLYEKNKEVLKETNPGLVTTFMNAANFARNKISNNYHEYEKINDDENVSIKYISGYPLLTSNFLSISIKELNKLVENIKTEPDFRDAVLEISVKGGDYFIFTLTKNDLDIINATDPTVALINESFFRLENNLLKNPNDNDRIKYVLDILYKEKYDSLNNEKNIKELINLVTSGTNKTSDIKEESKSKNLTFFSELTENFANDVKNKVIKNAMIDNKNILLEENNIESTIDNLKLAKEQGYKVSISLIIAPQLVAWHSNIDKKFLDNSLANPIPQHLFAKTVLNLAINIDNIYKTGLIDEITIYSRDNISSISKILEINTPYDNLTPTKIPAIVNEKTKRPLTEIEIKYVDYIQTKVKNNKSNQQNNNLKNTHSNNI